jgi:exopolysaccharide biosynthesis protein
MKNKVLYIPFIMAAAVFSLLLAACSGPDHEDTLANWKWDKVEANPSIVALGWTDVDSLYGDLPHYVNVYKSPLNLSSMTTNKDSVIVYVAVADMSRATFGVLGDVGWSNVANGVGSEKVFTPAQFYSKNKAYVTINGGMFFWDNGTDTNGFYYSQSSLYKDGVMLSPNQNYYSEDWVTLWYPTVGCFVQAPDGTFKATWTYYTNDGIDYSYDAPAGNDISKAPLDVPSATFPSKGTALTSANVKNAIGGATVLLHNGTVMNTYVQEMLLAASAVTKRPRTAIGYDATNKKLFFFVCEGDNMTKGVHGMTTADVAAVMKALGCTEALNLDGGGSSCMLINGIETIKPSDGSERAVLDACFIK